MLPLIRIITLASAVVMSSCVGADAPIPHVLDEPEAGPWCYVGTSSSEDAHEIEQLLGRNGILAVSEGSVVYVVFVREAFAVEALSLIKGMEGIYWDPTPENPPRPLRR